MLSFEPINDKSTPIASIKNKKKDNIIYLSEEGEPKKEKGLKHKMRDYDSDATQSESNSGPETFKEITLSNYNQRFSIIPNLVTSDKIFIAGPSGSGKTSIIRNY